MTYEVNIIGVRELRAELERMQGAVDPELGKALRAAAEPVKVDVQRRAEPFSARTASGVRVRRRGTMVRVEQGQRKTTGYHAQYGELQQRRMFDPALADNIGEVVKRANEAIDELAARVNAMP